MILCPGLARSGPNWVDLYLDTNSVNRFLLNRTGVKVGEWHQKREVRCRQRTYSESPGESQPFTPAEICLGTGSRAHSPSTGSTYQDVTFPVVHDTRHASLHNTYAVRGTSFLTILHH